MQLGTQHMFERTQVPIDIPDPISPRVQNQSYPGNVGDTIVRKWKENRTTRTVEGIKREHIPAVVGIIKDEMNVQEGADRFSKSLEEMFKECTTFYTKTTVLGDLNDDTMIFAMFHAVETADDKDKINVSYVINTLSTDLPRKNTKMNIASVSDFSNPDLTKEMIKHLTKESEAELKHMTRYLWPITAIFKKNADLWTFWDA